MPLTVITEDGTGKSDANSYVTVAEVDTYHESHLYPAAWIGASAEQKKAAVVMASRTLDAMVDWNGFRQSLGQALEWPRNNARRPGTGMSGGIGQGQRQARGDVWESNVIPKPLKDATAELSRLLLTGDRTAESETQGIKKVGLGQGAVEVEFDASDRATIIPEHLATILSVLGTVKGRGGGMIRKTKRA